MTRLNAMKISLPQYNEEAEARTHLHIDSAALVIRRYIGGNGSGDETENALSWLEDEFPRVRAITRELRCYLFSDDLFGFEDRSLICRRIYNQLLRRLS